MKNSHFNYLGNIFNRVCCLLLLLFSCNIVFAQKIKITGKVISAVDKMEIIGAAIQLDGTTVGTVTDLDGKFTLLVPQKGTLTVSYLGHKTVKVPLKNGQKFYSITMMEDSKLIDEVVVVGYGSMRKKEVTGSVARVETEELNKISTSDLGTALQGQVAGVNVQASSGQPGSQSNIQIRGISTLSDGGSSPLFVVDGVPYESDPGLSNNEIASIDILKDAASAAIYGTRGAAGVILITTKEGAEGRMKVSVDGYYGIQHITSSVPLLNTAQSTYVNLLSHRLDGVSNPTDEYAWTTLQQYGVGFFYDTAIGNVIQNNDAAIQNYSVNISGGKKDLTFNMSGNYFSQDGVIINSGFDRYNFRSNFNVKRDKWSITTTFGFKTEKQQSPGWGLLTESYKYSPTQSPIDPNASTITGNTDNENEMKNMTGTMARVKQKTNKNTENFNANFFVSYQILKNLSASTRFALNYTNDKQVSLSPLFKAYDSNGKLLTNSNRSSIQDSHGRSSNFTWETMVNWNKKIKKHDFKFTGVFSMEQYNYSYFYAKVMDVLTNDVPSLNVGTADMVVGTGSGQWGQDRTNSLVGMLGRFQYNYAGKYMFSASLRRDGSSRFVKENRWGYFPSVSAGWNISEESFWKKYKKVINSFKLRSSFGTTGNQNFADYSYSTPIYSQKDYLFGGSDTPALGTAQSSFANPLIKWETTQQLNFGIDLGLLNNKFTFSADVYKSNKKDMLFPMIVPPSQGSGKNSQVTLNVGDMTNQGIELSFGHRNRIGKANYKINATFSKNVNEVTNMGNASKMYYFSDGVPVTGSNNADKVTVIKEGYAAGSFMVMPTNGIINTEQKLVEYQKLNSNAKMGDLIYVDTNNDGVINDDDRVYGGCGAPKFEMGLNLSSDYKGFDFSANFYASVGNKVINGTKIYCYQNQVHRDLIYQWSEVNPTSAIPSYRGRDHDNYRGYADIWVEDGSFLRLKNIILGYSLPKSIVQKLSFTKCRFYIAADNLLTFTKYDGYDPEVGSNGLSKRGLDLGTYPISMQMRGGFQIEF